MIQEMLQTGAESSSEGGEPSGTPDFGAAFFFAAAA